MTAPAPGRVRVLLVHSSAELYGSDRVVLESVRCLVADGHAVTVAVPEPGPLVAPLEQAGAQVRVVPTVVLKKADMSPLGLVRVLLTALSVLPRDLRLVRDVDPQLVYVNTVNVPLWLPLARLLGRRTLCHVHEAEEGLPGPVARLLALPLLLAHGVVVNSRAAGDLLLATLPALGGRTTVVYNGVPGPGAAAADLPREPGSPARLVLVGRLSARKGTDVAVAAVAELRRRGLPVLLRLVGAAAPGGAGFEEQVRAQVARGGLEDAVRLEGFRADVWPHLAASDVVLVPSRAEPFGNVAVEAALARRPVVASRVQGLQEIVEPGATGLLVEPDDPLALADAVAALLGDWPRTRGMARQAERRAQERFGVDRYDRELLAVVERALGLQRVA